MKNLNFIDSARLFFFFALQDLGFSFPILELNPMSPALRMQILNHWTAKEVTKPYILMSRIRKSQDNLTLLVQVLTGTTTLEISHNIS